MIINENLIFLVLQGISGGAAGYITNKYAVNMLFNEYTPLKLGGVIKKNKQKFIEELSELVERDIINGSTLKEKVMSEEFKNEINNLCTMMLFDGLKASIKDLKLNELSNFEESKKSLNDFMQKNLELFIGDFSKNFLDNFKLEHIISELQETRISNSIYDLLMIYIDKNKKISDFTQELYDENSSLIISDIVNDDTKSHIKENINKHIEVLINEIFNEEIKIREILNKICEIVKIEDIVDTLQKSLKNKEIGFFINDNEFDNILERLSEFINLEESKELIENVINNICEASKNSEDTVYEILSEETKDIVGNFLKITLENMMPYLSKYIIDNKNEINKLIEESINESMEGFDGGIKNLIILKAKETFLNDDSSKTSAVSKIVEYIENYQMNEQSAKDMSVLIIDYLKEVKVSDIINYLDNDFVLNKLLDNNKNIIKFIIKPLLSKKVGEIINIDFKEIFNSYGKKYIYDFLFANRQQLSKKTSKMLCKSIDNKIDEFYSKDLKSIRFIDNYMRKLSQKSSTYLVDVFKKHENTVKEYFANEIHNSICEVDLKSESIFSKKIIENACIEKILEIQEEVISKYQNNRIIDLIDQIPNKEVLMEYLNDEICKYINNNLENMLDGKIKKIVYDNLITFNEEEICDLAQKFMGNELKPLSIFGGILGGIVGIIFGMFSNSINNFGFYENPISMAGSCLLMGLIGIMTNVIALKMLFYPYKKNKFLSKIPFLKQFSLGYIPAHRENLAVGIGNVIDNELLNGSKIKVLLESKKNILKAALINNVEKSNYKMITDFIGDKKSAISNYIYVGILNLIKNNSLNEFCSKRIENLKINKVIKKTHLDNIIDKAIKKRDLIEKSILKDLEKNIKKDEKIKNILSSDILLNIENLIENEINTSIKNNLVYISKEKVLKDVFLNNKLDYENLINKSLKEVLDNKILENIKNKCEIEFIKIIKENGKKIVDGEIKRYLAKELEGENTIGNSFNGCISFLINKNLYTLTSILSNKMIKYLNLKKEEISSLVKEIIMGQLNFLEKGIFLMAGGNSIVDECVNIMVSKKVPVFIDNNLYNLVSTLENGLNNSLYPTKIKKLEIKTSNINVIKVIDTICDDLSKNEFDSVISNFSEYTFNTLFRTKLVSMLKLINLDTVEKVYEKFCDEIYILENELSKNISDNINELNIEVNKIVKEDIIQYVYNIKLSELFKDINLEHSIKLIADRILSSNSFKKNIFVIVSDFYEINSKLQANSFIDENILYEDINRSINRITNIDKFNNKNLELINKIIQNAVESNINFIDDITKIDINDYIAETLVTSATAYTNNILRTVKLKEVTEEQIAHMDSKEIHMLFDSFAGDFFKKLYLYGSFGGVFGINLYLSIILVFLDCISEKNEKS